jgi:protein farnesyltransferase subunit beta
MTYSSYLVTVRSLVLDDRSTYTAISTASICNLLTPELTKNTAQFVVSCVRYEGGIGGEPGNEAHGGYTFCGLATLMLLQSTHLVNLDLMLKWAVDRQMRLEGGFQGRTNKLVDGCYSFWVGGLFPLFDILFTERAALRSVASVKSSNNAAAATTATSSIHGSGDEKKPTSKSVPEQSAIPAAILFSPHEWLFNQEALQRYLLFCAQTVSLVIPLTLSLVSFVLIHCVYMNVRLG